MTIHAEYLLLHALTESPAKALELDLEPHHFADADASILYAAIRQQGAAGKEFDPVGAMEAGCSLDFVREIIGGTGHISNAEHYAEKIRAGWKLRELGRLGVELSDSANDKAADPDAIAAKLMAEVNDLSRSTKAGDVDAKELAHQVANAIDRAHEAAASGKPLGIPSGIGALDRVLGGLHRTDLIIVAGRPGTGKTAFGMGVANHAASKGYRVGFVSAEMPSEQLGIRLAAMLGAVDASKIRNGRLRDEDWPRLTDALARMAQMPIRVYAQPGCRVGDAVRQATVWSRTEGLDLLVVDYLGRLKPDTKSDRRDLEVGEMTKALKNCAAQLNVPVLLLAQLNRNSENRADRKPRLADLRDSGEVEQEADSVLMLYRDQDEEGRGKAEILIEKNRHGECGYVEAYFDGPLMRWCDVPQEVGYERYA